MPYTLLRAYDNYVYANMQLGLLQDGGIDCHLKDEYTVTIDPFLSPALGGIKLMVESEQAVEAERLLLDAENDWLKTVPCPNCGEYELSKQINTRTFRTLLGKLRSMILNGQEQEVKMEYRCAACNKSFPEIA